ncbi:TetR/AcrR family transcriptional regulator [Pedobacter glucosidilyticus]|uniref:TetR/AcrR family transcriptional regulator n=1 Tax=Pedobacter glucosidilyticus TaxID=1122941 RepID=UPI0026EFA966|nr:TetR/AcrR family transcriptional regulator [Pedobacter glucosidilyticus]
MELKELDLEQRILEKARALFFVFGIKSISMDDIAKNLGISKKTLYQYYRDKTALLELIIDDLLETHGKEIENAQQTGKNAIQEVYLQTQVILNLFKNISPNIFFEISKYFPLLDERFTKHRIQCIKKCIRENIIRGMDEELYRKDLDIDFVAQIRLNQITAAFDEKAYPADEFSISDTLFKLTDFYLNAICQTAGKKLLNSIKTQYI